MQLHKQLGRADKRLARLPLLEAIQGASMRLAIFLVVLLHVISQAEHRRDRGRARKATLNSGPVAQNTGDIDKTGRRLPVRRHQRQDGTDSHGRSPWRARVRASKVEALGRGRVDDAGVVLLSRIQFAFVVTFPIIFAARAVELACAALSAFAFFSAASWLSVRIRPSGISAPVRCAALVAASRLHPNSPADVQRTRPA